MASARPLHRGEERLAAAMAARGPRGVALYELLRFGVKHGWACPFGGLMVGLLTALSPPPRTAAAARAGGAGAAS